MSEENNTGARKKEYEIPNSSKETKDNEIGKRQRTTSGNGLEISGKFGEIPASPPKFASLEEMMKAANGVSNMALAHEIAVNKDFKLEKYEGPENSIRKQVTVIVHKAFWDLLRAELDEDPPNFTRAMSLIEDVKTGLMDILLPQHTKIRQQISDILDVDLIKQQAINGTLDFQQYAQYVISVMGKLCAPVRDQDIANLTQKTDVVEIFKGILETLELMKLDMANFKIDVLRPHIVANSVQYEKQKFADYLKLNKDGLALTKEWLQRHLAIAEEHTDIKRKVSAVINDAYLEFLEWDKEVKFPETIVMDVGRILHLKREHDRAVLAGAILLLTYGQSGSDLCSISDFKMKLKDDVLTLLKSADSGEPKDMKILLEEISEKLKDDIKSSVELYGTTKSQTGVEYLTEKLYELTDPEHKILVLLKQRMREFLLATITSQTADPLKIPPGLTSLQKEVVQIAGVFLHLISHNRAVFQEYYFSIVEESLS